MAQYCMVMVGIQCKTSHKKTYLRKSHLTPELMELETKASLGDYGAKPKSECSVTAPAGVSGVFSLYGTLSSP